MPMVISEISPQKRKGRYNIFVDGEFFSGIDAEGIIKAGLKVGKEVQHDELEEVVYESEKRSAFDKIAGLISRQMYSERDIKNKLLKYGYSANVILGAINLAKEYGHISDKTFAKSFVSSKPLKSRMELKNALFQKGICEDEIASALQSVDKNAEDERAGILASKYMKNKIADQKTLASLYAFLQRKGFGYSSINKALKVYKEFEEFGDQDDWN